MEQAPEKQEGAQSRPMNYLQSGGAPAALQGAWHGPRAAVPLYAAPSMPDMRLGQTGVAVRQLFSPPQIQIMPVSQVPISPYAYGPTMQAYRSGFRADDVGAGRPPRYSASAHNMRATEQQWRLLGGHNERIRMQNRMLSRHDALEDGASAAAMPKSNHCTSPGSEQKREFRLNPAAAAFMPRQQRLAIAGANQIEPGVAENLSLPSTVSQPIDNQNLGARHSRNPLINSIGVPRQRYMSSQRSDRHRQAIPNLFGAIMSLLSRSIRPVSYPDIIAELSEHLQRSAADLKRHVPQILHTAVCNGYFRKNGNRYTLLSEQEQLQIIRRNQEAALRSREQDEEPLSWRRR